jgi:chromate transporter
VTQEAEDVQGRHEEVSSFKALPRQQQQQRLRELAKVFLRLGAIAFGGPAAHIAMMDREVAHRRQWMSREKLLDLLGITNLIPGPNSTELVAQLASLCPERYAIAASEMKKI